MAANSNPKGHIWSSDAVCDIITTKTNLLDCHARGGFHAIIHRDLLSYFSTYYAALIEGGFAEAGTDNIKFDLDYAPATLLVTWLYTGSISRSAQYSDIFDLYLFADMTDLGALRKDIIDYLFKNSSSKGNPDLGDVTKVCATLTMSSGLVRWMVDRYGHHWAPYNTKRPEYTDAVAKHKDFFEQVDGSHANQFMYECRNTGVAGRGDPCCDVPVAVHCNCGCEQRIKRKRPQSCRYHEHATIDEWRACAGGAFDSADMAYLRGTTAAGPKIENRFVSRWSRISEDGEKKGLVDVQLPVLGSKIETPWKKLEGGYSDEYKFYMAINNLIRDMLSKKI
ncbi:hypothetical protein D6D15_06727 [Aureobasidium pullulans]|uniref:BTB domain-containing protein n=1 Tax=Aureobasidium pullulans TaxID=5580 RepID=A0A4S9B402_AURPU|nr:hypothetical protein D6D15_06727 [Aureobasidium pullulans]